LVSTQTTKDRMEDFLERTTGSRKLFERASGSIPSGSTRAPFYYAPYPVYMKRGAGPYVWDVDDNKYLDFTNNMGPLVLGHRHPDVQKAVEAQVEALWCGGPTELEVRLAEKIKDAFPVGERVLFTPSGSEGTMKLIRAARAATGKDRIMLSTGAYHGSHDIVTSSPGIPKSYLSTVTRYVYNDEDSFVSAFRKDKGELGAVVMEAILGQAGSVPPTRSFIKTVREETEKTDVPLIMDEVVTGFRIGRGGISEAMGIEPDGVALGKIIGGGFPVGAFLGSERLMKEYEYTRAEFPSVGKPRLPQAGTFNAHPVSMAAGLATLDVLTAKAYEQLAWLGGEASRVLDKTATEYGVPHAMTGIGSIFFMHFSEEEVKNVETARSSDEKKGRMLDALLLSHGVGMPAFHSAFASLPMGKPEMALFERAVQASFSDMKKMGEI
jgi:glutamate-1-semialdehyde 2,1-aminomutase